MFIHVRRTLFLAVILAYFTREIKLSATRVPKNYSINLKIYSQIQLIEEFYHALVDKNVRR